MFRCSAAAFSPGELEQVRDDLADRVRDLRATRARLADEHAAARLLIAMLFGLALASLGGLDTAVREHFAGYRSHSTLLVDKPAVVTVAALAPSGTPFAAVAASGGVVFAAAF